MCHCHSRRRPISSEAYDVLRPDIRGEEGSSHHEPPCITTREEKISRRFLLPRRPPNDSDETKKIEDDDNPIEILHADKRAEVRRWLSMVERVFYHVVFCPRVWIWTEWLSFCGDFLVCWGTVHLNARNADSQ